MLISNGAPFAFRLRRERIDWKSLASVDIDKVAREVDFQTLQDNTANVTFCDIQAEVDPGAMDKNFIKLFRLAQLIIEYLIYSQDCLSAALASSEQESSEKSKQVAELEEKLKKEKSRKKNMDENLPVVIVDNGNQCKKFDNVMKMSKNRSCMYDFTVSILLDFPLIAIKYCVIIHRTSTQRMQMRISDPLSRSKHAEQTGYDFWCCYCPKMFFNQTYLRMHHERRHPGQPLVTSTDDVPTNPAAILDMGTELTAIKERLKLTEDRLKDEKAALDDAAVKMQSRILEREAEVRNEMETWKIEQLKGHKQDLENTKDLFKKELDILQEKYLMSERQLKQLQQKTVPTNAEPILNPAMLIAEGKETNELMKRQQLEISEMKELLRQQVLNMGKNVQQQLKEQEDHWESKVSQMEGKYHEEIRKLKGPAYSKKVGSEQLLHLPDMELSLNRQIKELEKLNILQKNTSEKKKRRCQRKDKKSHVKLHVTPNEENLTNTQDLNIMGEINYSNDQSLASSHFTNTDPLPMYDPSVRHNPIIIQGMRDEVSNLLDEKLESMGISKNAKGVKESTLKRKLTNRLNERQELTRKYKNLNSLREQLQFQVDKMAQSKLTAHRRSSTPAKAKNSIRKLLNSVKEKVAMVRSRSRSPSPAVPPRETSLSPLKSPQRNSLSDTLEGGSYDTFRSVPSTNESIKEKGDEDLSTTDTESSSDLETSPRLSSSGKPAGVPALARSLEKQFESRKGPPTGGVNVFPVRRGLATTKDKPSSNLWLKPKTSTPDASKNKPVLGSQGEPENSSIRAASNDSGAKASKAAECQKQRDEEMTASPFNSLSSWDSDNEISEIS